MIILSGTFLILNTLLCGILIAPFAILKALSRPLGVERVWNPVILWLGTVWVTLNKIVLEGLGLLKTEVSGQISLDEARSVLVLANHQTWVDIMVLQSVLLGRAPFLRFFLKSELAWVPIMNMAWWALDYPFMRRFSVSDLRKDPRRKGQDLRTAEQAGRRFRGKRVAVLNFVEGTRFSPRKREAQASPYRSLLIPKTGGISALMEAMGDDLQAAIDVTLVYSEKKPGTFLDLLAGRIGTVKVQLRQHPLPASTAELRPWINQVWQEKDGWIQEHQPSQN